VPRSSREFLQIKCVEIVQVSNAASCTFDRVDWKEVVRAAGSIEGRAAAFAQHFKEGIVLDQRASTNS
jgi:hypothetical protein